MDCIDLFKRAAMALQTDSRYLAMDQARKMNDKDEELQNLIGEFNLARMDLKKFLLYTTLGAGAWNSVLALLGYLIHIWFPELTSAKDISDKAAEYSHEIGWCILGLLALVCLWFAVKYYIRRRRA